MLAGYMRSKSKPGHMAKLLAIMCQYEGIDFICFTPEDVSIETKTVTGYMLIKKKWKKVTTELPGFIDINPNYFNKNEYIELIRFLKENTFLSSDKRMPLPKDKLQKVFKSDPEISQYLIPSKNVDKIEDVKGFINKYSTVVLKPVLSNKGRNIYKIKKEESYFLLGFKKTERKIKYEEFKVFFNTKIKNKGFIVQKFITSKNSEGHPFDCRIHVEKDDKGKWKNVKNIVRIGIGQTVISNFSQGGGVIPLKKFLTSTYGKKWRPIYNEIKNIAHILPNKIEEVLGREYMCFGFDIGIDKEGFLYVFEVNDFPMVFPMKSEIAMTRAGYYRYMLEKSNNSF